jgi:hypothetical protein
MLDFFTAEELVGNYEKFRKLINQTFSGDRLESLNKMYDHFEDRILYTPASSFEHFHNAFPGGYIDHVLRVTRNAVKTYEHHKDLGIDLEDLSKETVIFTALHHDLGKLGNVDEDFYIKNDSEWHVKNQGKIYKTNPDIHWMNTNDRTFYLLNYFGVKCTEEEWIGMKLTDGLYDDSNNEYLTKTFAGQKLKTPLPHIMHQADLNACTFEFQRWSKEMNPVKSTRKPSTGRPAKGNLTETFANNDVKPTSVFDAFKGIIED